MKWWRNIKDIVLSFYYPPGQFFLVSFPNSGRTWLMYMVQTILKEVGIEIKGNEISIDTSSPGGMLDS